VKTRGANTSPSRADVALARALAAWFAHAARDLPWRNTTPPQTAAPLGARRDPWASLVSELMLQQTQVSRVLQKFEPFLRRFPTAVAMAAAPEHDVLAMWSGLGYYRRARLLHAAAKAIVERHGGEVPRDLAALQDLPGVGRYTAGAIASIVFGAAAPIVDGNVTRVLLRLSAKHSTAAAASDWAWSQADALVSAAVHAEVDVGAMNEGLMELGATVCTPKAARCDACPISKHCEAFATGVVDRIPAPKTAAARKSITADVRVLICRDRVLVRRRPARGMWANLWEAPTIERPGTPDEHAADAPLLQFLHKTTHRDVYFRVWHERTRKTPTADGERWVTLAELDELGLSNPQAGILRAALGHRG